MVDVLGAVSLGDSIVDGIWIAIGVLISVILPVLAASVRTNWTATAAAIDFGKYAMLAGFCIVVALLALAIYRSQKPDEQIVWYAGLLAGYGWEATVEKLGFGPKLP